MDKPNESSRQPEKGEVNKDHLKTIQREANARSVDFFRRLQISSQK